jgi:hypothetical protein
VSAARSDHAGDNPGDTLVYVVLTIAVLTCPVCALRATETMPVDACQYFYDCSGCGERLSPLPGDCCVFCSYSDVRCPPNQRDDR